MTFPSISVQLMTSLVNSLGERIPLLISLTVLVMGLEAVSIAVSTCLVPRLVSPDFIVWLAIPYSAI